MKGYQCDRCKQCYPCNGNQYKLETYSVSSTQSLYQEVNYDLCPACYKKLLTLLDNIEGDNHD